MMGNYYGDYGSGFGIFGFGFMWLFGILFWISVIIGIVIIVKWLLGRGGKEWRCFGCGLPRHGGGSSRFGGGALEILKERYAKGEITKNQYEEMKKELSD